MNNEKYNQIIDEVYERYWDSIKTSQYDGFGPTSIKLPTLTKQEFINKCKTDSEFSEKWGLKIEERELSLDERARLYEQKTNASTLFFPVLKETLTFHNIPTKLITVTYNNETIEVYE